MISIYYKKIRFCQRERERERETERERAMASTSTSLETVKNLDLKRYDLCVCALS